MNEKQSVSEAIGAALIEVAVGYDVSTFDAPAAHGLRRTAQRSLDSTPASERESALATIVCMVFMAGRLHAERGLPAPVDVAPGLGDTVPEQWV